jgi:hypothetical protein
MEAGRTAMHYDGVAIAHHGCGECGDLPFGLDCEIAVLVIGPGISDTRLRSAIERRDTAIDLPRFAGLIDLVDVATHRCGRNAEPLLELAHRSEGAIPQQLDDLTLAAGVAQRIPSRNAICRGNWCNLLNADRIASSI